MKIYTHGRAEEDKNSDPEWGRSMKIQTQGGAEV